MSFKVIVDSCCDLTPSLLREEDFLSVPLTIRVGDHVVVDDASFDQADLLWRMKECETAPQTSCPAPAQYLDAFACGADDLYVITLSARLSGSHNSAQQARQLWLEEHPQARVHIFNSCSASAGEVLLALKVRELAAKGLPFQTVVSEATAFCTEMTTMFVLESLDNLRKNGRLTGLQSVVTGALRIKLLMGATPEGEIYKRGQAMSVKQALSKMVEIMSKDAAHAGKLLAIAHCNCLERAFQLKEMVRKSCHFSDILITETGGISTVYANDGGIVVGAGFFEELAVFESEFSGFDEIGIGSDDIDGLIGFVANSNCGDVGGDRGDGFDIAKLGDRGRVVECEAGLGILVVGGKLVDEIFGELFAGAWTDEDEVGIVFVRAGANEAADAASERHNQYDRSDADGDAECREESAGAIAVKAIERDAKMCSK